MRVRLAALLIVTALCLAWVLHGLDFSEALLSVRRFKWAMLVPIWGLYLTAHALRAQRFRVLLPTPLDYRASFSSLTIGYLALHVFPFRLGELVRPYLVREQRGVPFGDSLAVVVVERILDVMMLLVMILGTTWFVHLPTRLEVGGFDLLAVAQRGAGVLVLAGVLGVVGVLLAGEPLLRRTDRLPLGGVFRQFHGALLALARRPAVAAQAFVLSVVIWLLTLFAVQAQLYAFGALPHGFLDALGTWTATLSGMTILPTPGFFGGFEAACSAALQLLGAPAAEAAPFALLLHLTQFVFTIVLGSLFLAIEGLSLREVVAASRGEPNGGSRAPPSGAGASGRSRSPDVSVAPAMGEREAFILLRPQVAKHTSGFVVMIASRHEVVLEEIDGSVVRAEAEFGGGASVYVATLTKCDTGGLPLPLTPSERSSTALRMVEGLRAMGGPADLA